MIKLRTWAMLMSFIPALCCCSSKSEEEGFMNSGEALQAYRSCLQKVKAAKHSNTGDFGDLVCEWKQTHDTVYHYLVKDSAFIKNDGAADRFFALHDSVKSEMLKLSETWQYGYADVLKLKENTSSFKEDEELQQAVHEAEPFFESLNGIATGKCDKTSILQRYRYFLAEVNKSDIRGKDDMLAFIKREDFFFRTFLEHLYEMNGESLADITQSTDLMCQKIFLAAREGKIQARNAVVYMSMRTVRRLLQNSVVCVNDINHRDMKDKSQGNAYLWMIIQPFVSIDEFSLATLTSTERNNFDYIAKNLPKSNRFAKAFNIDQHALNYLLPQQLLKMYILTL